MAAQTEHRKKMSKFYAAQEGDVDIEDTEIGRVRIKLSRLMAKKMSGNPAFKRSVKMMQELVKQGGESKLAQKLSISLEHRKEMRSTAAVSHIQDNLKKWQPMNT
ncbi:hypothetical protein DPMN_103537 [Dreissena polymorpha]|uniref:Uncharacterized protein n=1 Tax=Dreissena polymorpha TaxID=45954 RepID=A0A9D4HEG8_DREPO|nr:hypothetical protein DPMN_103537 [Dreissena polymorpha]